MSLKAFHIVFVVISTLFTIGFGYWAVAGYKTSGETGLLVGGVVSFAGAVALLIYGRWFLKKLRGVSYL